MERKKGLLIDRFLDEPMHLLKKLPTNEMQLARSGMQALLRGVRECLKIYFAESTCRMLLDRREHYDEVVEQIRHLPGIAPAARGIWYEFSQPIQNVQAFFVWIPSTWLSTGKDCYQLSLIGEDASLQYIAEAKENESWYFASEFHWCKMCRWIDGVYVSCPACNAILTYWSEMLVLCSIIAGQQLASVTYEEKIFHGLRHEKREHSNKERRIPSKHLFRVIDANEIVIPVRAESRQDGQQRGSWLDGTEVYTEIRTRPFIRTYRHERYVNMRGQSREYPEGIVRRQPVKRENVERKIVKVRASQYEKGQHADNQS